MQPQAWPLTAMRLMDTLALKLDPNYMAVRRGIPVMHVHIGNAELDIDPTEGSE